MLGLRSFVSLPPAPSSSTAGAQWMVSFSTSELQIHWEAVRWPKQLASSLFIELCHCPSSGCGLFQKGRGCLLLYPPTLSYVKFHFPVLHKLLNEWREHHHSMMRALSPRHSTMCPQCPFLPHLHCLSSDDNNTCPTSLRGLLGTNDSVYWYLKNLWNMVFLNYEIFQARRKYRQQDSKCRGIYYHFVISLRHICLRFSQLSF